VEIGSLVRPVRELKESKKRKKKKKKKKRQGKKLTVANWVFAQTTHVDAAICMGLPEVVLSFKFRQNRLNGFRDVGGSKFAISYT